MYKEYIDPAFTYQNFSLEEQSKILAAGRSNNELDSTKLVETCKSFGIVIPHIQESIKEVFKRMRENLANWITIIPLICGKLFVENHEHQVFYQKKRKVVKSIEFSS